jgi:hypothetical protein
LKVLKWGLATIGLVAAAGVIAVSAGVFSGVAQAQERQEDKAARHAAYNEKLAEKLGVSIEELEAAQKEARDEMIDEALAAGLINAEEAERMKSGQPGMMRQRGVERVRGAVMNVIEAAAGVLGVNTDEVRAGFREGKSLNEIAAEQGVGNFEAQLVARLTADIQAKLADGSITETQANRLLENLPEMVSRIAGAEHGDLRERMGPGGRFGPRSNQN